MTKKKTQMTMVFLILLIAAVPVTAAHKDCSDYCGIDIECKEAIEYNHDFWVGCSNYGFPPGGQVFKGALCSNVWGARSLHVNSMQCTPEGVCYGMGVFKCGGIGNNPQINVTCVPPPGGTAEFVLTMGSASCTRSNATGYTVSCAEGGGLVWGFW